MQCDYFDSGRCRSCTLMGVPYEQQLRDKQQRVADTLAGVAPGAVWAPPYPSAESAFRNKAKLVVGGQVGAVTVGILDGDNRGVDLRGCGLYEPGLAELVPRLADVVDDLGLEPYDVPSRRGEVKHLIVTHAPSGAAMLRFVLRSQRHLALLRSRLPLLRERLPEVHVVSVNLQPEHKAVLEGPTELLLTEQELLPMQVNDVTLGLRPNSFFQTNTDVAAALYRQARDWVAPLGAGSLWDLYCGVGGFALHCADRDGRSPGSVVGVEVSPEAVASARASAEALRQEHPGLGPLHFHAGDATAAGDEHGVGGAPDVVVVNPPRRGIGARLAGWLEGSTVEHVVYSSCNADSLARDLAHLPSFTAREARLFDMFPQTTHHEVMVRLERTSGAR